MAFPDPRFIPVAFALDEYFVDKDTGEALSAGVVKFYKDTNRGVLKNIYQQVQLPNNDYEFVLLDNPVTLSSVGTFADNTGAPIMPFYYPFTGTPTDTIQGTEELYYVTVESSALVTQFTREAQPSGFSADTNPKDVFEGTTNAISNSQFVEVSFLPVASPGITYTVSGSTRTQIAPDWAVNTTGSGTFTVFQDVLALSGAITNPPYALNITSTGITAISLSQILSNSPRLFASGYVSSSFVAASKDGNATPVNMYYRASNGSQYNCAGVIVPGNGVYTEAIANTYIDTSAHPINPDPASTGFVDILIAFPVYRHISITSIQLVSVQNSLSTTPYLQEPTARQIDHLYHDDRYNLFYKPIPSLLTGWDFPLNPSQISGNAGSFGAAKYLWDQTIGRDLVGANYTRYAQTGGLVVTTTGVSNAFYLMQYLSGAQAQKMMGTPLSVNISAFRDSASTGLVTAKIYLFRGSAAAAFPGLPTTIGTVNGAGVFTLTAANWSEIPNYNLGGASLEIPKFTSYAELENTANDIRCSYWQEVDPAHIADTDKFAMVVTFAYAAAAENIIINSISLVPGKIPTRPAPQTANQVLQECQYYYEKSYPLHDTEGAITAINCYTKTYTGLRLTGPDRTTLQPLSFGVSYSEKRTIPATAIYSPTVATPNFIEISINRNNTYPAPTAGTNPTNVALATAWGYENKGTSSFSVRSTATSTALMTIAPGQDGDEVILRYHWAVNAQLGIV